LNTLQSFNFDGRQALASVVALSPYGTLEQAVASLTVFSHPETVAQTGCKPLVRVIRSFSKRDTCEQLNGRLVGYDDNQTPTDFFLWCNGIKRKDIKDVQFNHVYTASQDPDSYTCLANLCMSPSFLAKLTDTHNGIRALLRYRAYDLYRWHLATEAAPIEPAEYGQLDWAAPHAPVRDLSEKVRADLAKSSGRTARLCQQLGWLFGS
jgi:hypothetical protein